MKLWGIKDDHTFDVCAKFQPQIRIEDPWEKKLQLKSAHKLWTTILFFLASPPRMFFDAKSLHECWMFDHILSPKLSDFSDFFILFWIYCSWGCPCTRELKVWQCDETQTKYRLIKWDVIFRLKDQGGLGIENLKVKNRCLLSKWLYRLSVETEGTWVQILRNKCLQPKTLAKVTVRPNDSLFWKVNEDKSSLLP